MSHRERNELLTYYYCLKRFSWFSDYFGADHDRQLAEVSYDFFSISLAPTNIVVSGHTKNTENTEN